MRTSDECERVLSGTLFNNTENLFAFVTQSDGLPVALYVVLCPEFSGECLSPVLDPDTAG